MNLLQIDIKQSKIIPSVAIILLLTQMTVAFFDMEMFLASYAALAGMLVAFVLSTFLLVRKKTLHLFDIYILLFAIILEGLSIFNGADWKNCLYLMFSISTSLFLFNYYQDRYNTLVFWICIVLSVAIYSQLIQCLLHPEMWLLESKQNYGFLLGGNYNQMGSRFIIALITGLLSVKFSKWFWINLVPLFICCFAILFMVRSMTSLTGLFLFLVLCLIRNQKAVSLGTIVMFIGIILFQVFVCFSGRGFENNEFARWFVMDILEKDMTFTGRTHMWDSALRVIAESPIWGHGLVDADWFRANMTTLAVGAHNFILNTMVYGGIILLVLYITIVIHCFQKLIHVKDIFSKKMMATYGILSIMMLFEVYEMPFVFLLLTIMFYYPGEEPTLKLTADEREQ
jgi:O-antigen ligase